MSGNRGGAQSTRLSLSRHPSRRRLFAMLIVTILAFGAVAGRLAQLQVLSGHQYAEIGQNQRIHSVKLSADRGTIFDRAGNDIAMSVPQQTVWADPTAVKDAYSAAAQLSPILNMSTDSLVQKLKTSGRFVYLARTVDDGTASKIKALKIPGIAMYEEPKRFMAGDDLLKSVVGQVGLDNEGLSGLEVQYEKALKGSPGRMVVEQDSSGQDIPGGTRQEQPAVRGDDLMLTIDRDLQYKVEDALTQEIQRANAKGGMAAVMDTKTGEVLALSNLQVPRGGAGKPVEAAGSNMALTNVYEPGSVSKLITMSAALESGVVSPSSSMNVPDSLHVADAIFHDADPHPNEQWSATDIIAASSNIGTISIAQKLGKDKLDHFQRLFGYGSTTGLKFPGESAGLMLDPKKYSGTSLATTAIGQGVSVTAMQMLSAYNTIANNGVYVAPKLVKSTIDSSGDKHDTPASSTRQVVSPKTAQQMNLMLQEVTRVGTATAARIDGYSVAGKTGTARKPKSNGSGYEDGAYISSFAGFVPAENPRFTSIVILDQPTPIFGGLVAAPVFSDIMRHALQEYRVAPQNPSGDRHGVPFASASASSAASESDAAPGTTADAANAATAQANKGSSSTSTESPSSPTASSGSGSTGKSTTSTTGPVANLPRSNYAAASSQSNVTR